MSSFRLFCLARLPFSWSFNCKEKAFLKVLFVFILIDISGLLASLELALEYMWQKTQGTHCHDNA